MKRNDRNVEIDDAIEDRGHANKGLPDDIVAR
jgi:hypothetical protein